MKIATYSLPLTFQAAPSNGTRLIFGVYAYWTENTQPKGSWSADESLFITPKIFGVVLIPKTDYVSKRTGSFHTMCVLTACCCTCCSISKELMGLQPYVSTRFWCSLSSWSVESVKMWNWDCSQLEPIKRCVVYLFSFCSFVVVVLFCLMNKQSKFVYILTSYIMFKDFWVLESWSCSPGTPRWRGKDALQPSVVSRLSSEFSSSLSSNLSLSVTLV